MWDNENGTTFKFGNYYTTNLLTDNASGCVRVYFGARYDDESIDGTGDFNDMGCQNVLPFVCEMECYQ